MTDTATSPMRTVSASLTAVAASLALACGDEPQPQSPTVCGDAIPQQRVFVGGEVTVKPCFEDPGGGTLTLSATSSDELSVGAFVRGQEVLAQGRSVGDAKVKVTATNEANLTAETSFSVVVPNRAPEFVSGLKDVWVFLDESIQWELTEFFKDPDGELMTFAATSSDSGAVGVSITGTVAEVSGLSAGESQITLTATDPHGASGSGTIDVAVKTLVTLIEDDFGTDASLDDWETPDDDDFMSAEVENGYLVLTSDSHLMASVSRELGGEAEHWTVDVVLKNPVEDARSGFILWTGHDRYPYYLLLVGEAEYGDSIGRANWILFWRDESQGVSSTRSWAWGLSDDIDDFSDLAISVTLSRDSIRGTVDGNPLFAHGDEDYLVNTAVALGLAASPEDLDGAEGNFNSVRLLAVDFTESSPAARARKAPAGLEELRLRKR